MEQVDLRLRVVGQIQNHTGLRHDDGVRSADYGVKGRLQSVAPRGRWLEPDDSNAFHCHCLDLFGEPVARLDFCVERADDG
jgi:hypothetical protein